MKKFIWFFIILTLSPLLLFSQKIEKVRGEAQLELPEYRSRADVKKEVLEMALKNGMENAFGTLIIQGNSTYIKNEQTGQKIETSTYFNSVANSYVKGEVVGEPKPEYTDLIGKRTIDGKVETYIEIKCVVEFLAKEITTPKIEFTALTLKCPDEKCQTTDFKVDDELYILFSSPVSGYISIFIDEEGLTQCLYPYHTMPEEYEGGVPVVADKKYILFSPKPEFNYFSGKNYITAPYLLDTRKPVGYDRIFIIFSKTPLSKPSLSEAGRDEKGNVILPKELKSEDFQKWLIKCHSFEKGNLVVDHIDITIKKST
ncbi:MAG: hypothetical protein NTZ85_10535 [Bacteroidia bacterium]|jgi:hypothetical protein|nr:hypothetical protein [Bacteroidia bacterium]